MDSKIARNRKKTYLLKIALLCRTTQFLKKSIKCYLIHKNLTNRKKRRNRNRTSLKMKMIKYRLLRTC